MAWEHSNTLRRVPRYARKLVEEPSRQGEEGEYATVPGDDT
jgi:hypothetical protein